MSFLFMRVAFIEPCRVLVQAHAIYTFKVGLNATEIQIPYDEHHVQSVLIGKKSPKHAQFCQT